MRRWIGPFLAVLFVSAMLVLPALAQVYSIGRFRQLFVIEETSGDGKLTLQTNASAVPFVIEDYASGNDFFTTDRTGLMSWMDGAGGTADMTLGRVSANDFKLTKTGTVSTMNLFVDGGTASGGTSAAVLRLTDLTNDRAWLVRHMTTAGGGDGDFWLTSRNVSTFLTPLKIAQAAPNDLLNMTTGGSGRVGIRTTSPNNTLEVVDTTTPQVRFAYDTSNYATHSVSSAGVYTVIPTGITYKVQQGAGSALTASTSYDDFVVDLPASGGMSLLASGTNNPGINFNNESSITYDDQGSVGDVNFVSTQNYLFTIGTDDKVTFTSPTSTRGGPFPIIEMVKGDASNSPLRPLRLTAGSTSWDQYIDSAGDWNFTRAAPTPVTTFLKFLVGTGVVQFTRDVVFVGNASPLTDDLYDLGDATHRWNEAHLGTGLNVALGADADARLMTIDLATTDYSVDWDEDTSCIDFNAPCFTWSDGTDSFTCEGIAGCIAQGIGIGVFHASDDQFAVAYDINSIWSLDVDSGGVANYQTSDAGDDHIFKTGGTERMRIDSSGVQIGVNGTGSVLEQHCGNVSMDPPSIASLTSGDATGDVTNNLSANAACSCSIRTDFDDDLIVKYCYATGTAGAELAVRLYNPTLLAIDAGAQTVDFCCFEK